MQDGEQLKVAVAIFSIMDVEAKGWLKWRSLEAFYRHFMEKKLFSESAYTVQKRIQIELGS